MRNKIKEKSLRFLKEKNQRFLSRRMIHEFQFWIILGTVLEAMLTFWLFLVHWVTFPIRVIRRVLKERRNK